MIRVKGTVDKIWTNKTQAGKRYNVIEVSGGARYSLWDGDYFDKIRQGQEIDFEYKETGRFKNISRIYDGSESNPGSGNEKETSAGGNGSGNNGNDGNGREYTGDRLEKMIKMSCLKSASSLMTGSKTAYGDRAEKTIELAKQFERYINSELLEGNPPAPS